jgi:hypothetical protein
MTAFGAACSPHSPRAKVKINLPIAPSIAAPADSLQTDANGRALAIGESLSDCKMQLEFHARSLDRTTGGYVEISDRVTSKTLPLLSWYKYFLPADPNYSDSPLVSFADGSETSVELEVETGKKFTILARGMTALAPKPDSSANTFIQDLLSRSPAGLFTGGLTETAQANDYYTCPQEISIDQDYFEDMSTDSASSPRATIHARYLVPTFGVSNEVSALSEGASKEITLNLSVARVPLAAYSTISLGSGYGDFPTATSFSPFLRIKVENFATRVTLGSGSTPNLNVFPLIRDLDSNRIYRGVGGRNLNEYSSAAPSDTSATLYPIPGRGNYRVMLVLKCRAETGGGTCSANIDTRPPFNMNSGDYFCFVRNINLSKGMPSGVTVDPLNPQLLIAPIDDPSWKIFRSPDLTSYTPESGIDSSQTCEEALEVD